MNGRRVAIGLGVLAVVLAGGWFAFTRLAPQATIDVSQAELQARLDAQFPQKSCAMMLACVTLSAPVVTLTEGSERIGLAADVLVSLGRRQMPGKVAFSGVLRYVRNDGDFYFDDVQIDNFALSGFPPELVEVVRARGPAAIQRALEHHPVYSLKGAHGREKLARLAVRDVRVVDGKVRVSFISFGD